MATGWADPGVIVWPDLLDHLLDVAGVAEDPSTFDDLGFVADVAFHDVDRLVESLTGRATALWMASTLSAAVLAFSATSSSRVFTAATSRLKISRNCRSSR